MLDEFSEHYTDFLDGTYDCVDRIVVNAYLRIGQTPGGFRTWWRSLEDSDDNLDNAHFLILVSRAPAPVWDVQRAQQGKIGNIARKTPWPYVNHYSFHIIDPAWGHVTIKLSGHPPFGAQIILNGHSKSTASEAETIDLNTAIALFRYGSLSSSSIPRPTQGTRKSSGARSPRAPIAFLAPSATA